MSRSEPDYRLGRLKGQFVVVWYDESGKRRRYRLGTDNAADARARLREFTRQRNQLQQGTRPLTIADIWQAYIADRKEKQRVSVARMEDAWKAMKPHFAELTATDLADESQVRAYTEKRREQGVGDGTIHTELGYLRAALSRAVSVGTLTRMPPVTLPSKPRPRDRWLTGEEVRRLAANATMPHVRLFILLAVHTAARPSSILDLTWDRVDFKARKIQFDNPARDSTPKGRATVPMNDDLAEELEKAKKAAISDHVIEWGGAPVKSIKKGIARAAERAGLERVSAYVLRHTAAVWMAQAGRPMERISQYLGHTSTAVTERVYARFAPDHLREEAEAINTVLRGSTNQKSGE